MKFVHDRFRGGGWGEGTWRRGTGTLNYAESQSFTSERSGTHKSWLVWSSEELASIAIAAVVVGYRLKFFSKFVPSMNDPKTRHPEDLENFISFHFSKKFRYLRYLSFSLSLSLSPSVYYPLSKVMRWYRNVHCFGNFIILFLLSLSFFLFYFYY